MNTEHRRQNKHNTVSLLRQALSLPRSFQAKMEQVKTYSRLLPKSQGQNLALTVLHVPNSRSTAPLPLNCRLPLGRRVGTRARVGGRTLGGRGEAPLAATCQPMAIFSPGYQGKIPVTIHRNGYDLYQHRLDGPFPEATGGCYVEFQGGLVFKARRLLYHPTLGRE